MQLLSYIKHREMQNSHGVMLSCKYVWRKGKMRLKYDMEEWEIESVYDTTKYMVNFVTTIQPEYIYGNIGHAYY